MKVSDLIRQLETLNPNMIVLHEVNGDVTRTGDFMPLTLKTLGVIPVSYGGYEDAEACGEEEIGKIITAAVIA